MGKLKFHDFRSVRAWVFISCAWTLAIPTANAVDRDILPAPSWHRMVVVPVQAATGQGTKAEIQNIQRLLKLLADRYPQTYGSVDPGKVDGRLRKDTREAIRNFRAITGSTAGKLSNEELAAEILAALAQISATKTAEVKSDVPKATPAPQPPAPDTRSTPSTPAIPRVTPPAASAKASIAPVPAPKKPTPPKETIQQANAATPAAENGMPPLQELVAVRDGTPGQNRVRRLYFVQAASLNSLEAAKKEWRRIFEENRAALRGEQVYFERAEIANRGVFYRILIGPIAERDAARTLCGYLKQNDQSCVVTSRNVADLPTTDDKQNEPALKHDSGGNANTPGSPDMRQAQASTAAETPPNPDAGATGPAAPVAAAPAEETKADSTEARSPDKSTSPEQLAPGGQAPERVQPVAAADPAPPATTPEPPVQKSGMATAPGSESQSGTKDPANAAPTPSVAAPSAPKAPDAPASPTPSMPPPVPAAPAAAQTSETAAPSSGASGAARPVQTSPIAAVNRLLDTVGNTTQAMGLAAALVVSAGLLLLLWRRQARRSSFAQIFQGGNLPLARAAAAADEPEDTLRALETDFESEALRQSRSVRDAFLMDILGDQVNEESTRPKEDSAIRINSSLKSLLVSDPAQYKSIFLNWIFLAKVGTALNDREITLEQMNGKFSREFDLLQNYFKIHLLELDDRHRIRKQLPGLFYCLQVAQERRRKATTRFSAA